MSDLTVGTHWADCWKDRAHHGCALARIAALEADLDTQTAMTVRALADRDANIAAWERVLGRRSEGEAQAYVRGLESALAGSSETTI